MEVQTQVAHRLRADPGRVRGVLAQALSDGDGRIGLLTERVCEAFGLRDGRGRLQRASCHRALRALPAPQQRGRRRPREVVGPVARPEGVADEVGKVGGLELVRVDSDAQLRIWNTLMAREHPRGAGPFVGAQVRYLAASRHGWLGAVGLAASARWLRARDDWIGWDDACRRDHLHRVAGLCFIMMLAGVLWSIVPQMQRNRDWPDEWLPVPADLLIQTVEECRRMKCSGGRLADVMDSKVVCMVGEGSTVCRDQPRRSSPPCS